MFQRISGPRRTPELVVSLGMGWDHPVGAALQGLIDSMYPETRA